jgi:hypothetical protein
MKIRIFNRSTYPRRVFVSGSAILVQAKSSVEIECIEEEIQTLKGIYELEVIDVDKIESDRNVERSPSFSVQQSSVDFLTQTIFLEVLKLRGAIENLQKDITLLFSEIEAFKTKDSTFVPRGLTAMSSLLNQETTPKESRRAIFEKIVKSNIELRKDLKEE